MKKIAKTALAFLILSAMLISLPIFSGCAKKDDNGDIRILCTVFPLYDWARNVAGNVEGISVELLVKSGTDLHSYQPSFADMAAIKDSRAVIYVGGESDRWIEDSIADGTVAVKLTEADGVTLYDVAAESVAEGQDHSEHSHDHIFDEHIWLSLRNASASAEAICAVLSDIDSTNAHKYRENTDAYKSKLVALDRKMEEISSEINEQLIFADRFPFIYLFEDYGIDYLAAFEGCTTDVNADFDTVVRLASGLAASKCGHLFTTETPNTELVESIIRQSGTNADTSSLDSMQSLGTDSIESSSYINIMERNIDVLQQICTKTED